MEIFSFIHAKVFFELKDSTPLNLWMASAWSHGTSSQGNGDSARRGAKTESRQRCYNAIYCSYELRGTVTTCHNLDLCGSVDESVAWELQEIQTPLHRLP